MVTLLLDHNDTANPRCDVNMRTAEGETALIIACTHGHGAVVRALSPLTEGTDQHTACFACRKIKDNRNRTPLVAAAEAGAEDVVRFLVSHKPTEANPSKRSFVESDDIADALRAARKGGHAPVGHLLLRRLRRASRPRLESYDASLPKAERMEVYGITALEPNS